MSFKKTLSNQLGAWARTRCERSWVRGEPESTSLALWAKLPASAKVWLWHQVFEPNEQWAHELLSGDHPLSRLELPSSNGWNLSPLTRLLLYQTIERKRPARMIEFGGGVSTTILADYARRHGLGDDGDPVICSVDHDENWLRLTQENLTRLGLADRVRFVHAPLAQRRFGDVEFMAYDVPDDVLGACAADHGFDLCLVDGPPQPVGRGPCLLLAASYLAPGALLLLDDFSRDEEQAVWRQWRERYPHLKQSRLILTSRGLARGTWSTTPARSAAPQWSAGTSTTR